MKRKERDSKGKLEELASARKPKDYVLRLYVTGSTLRSTRAIANVRKICEEHLGGHYRLEVIDLYQQPELAQSEQIVAVPTLIKELPAPVRRVLGDMSKTERVLFVLGLKAKLVEDLPVAEEPA